MPSTSSRKRVPPWANSNSPGLPPFRGAGEGPLLVAEQLALQQVFRHGGAVDGHEGPAGAGEALCTAWANSSLPVPVSPMRSTGRGVRLIFLIW